MRIESHRYLAFSLCNELYAIPLLQVKEVIARSETTPIPYAPVHFKGIMNLRGQVISIIDLRVKFKMSKADSGPETSVIILDLAPLCIGVVVDSIDSVMALDTSEISPPPDVQTALNSECLKGVAKKDSRLILLVDIRSTLDIDDMKTLKNPVAA